MIENYIGNSEWDSYITSSRLDITDNDASLKTREIVQHYIVLKEIFHFSKRHDTLLTVDSIKKWHSMLMKGIIGNHGVYREEDVFAGQRIFISPELIEKTMFELVRKYNQYRPVTKSSPYAVSAWLSHAFVSIHPFIDGNGRMGRILANYVMFSYGFPFPVPISADNCEYLKSLRLADRDYENGKDTSNLALIFLDSSHSIYNNYLSNLEL
ncbi:hypothetical protein ACTFIY_004885 [Dictyostelium cf. discoideum]